MTAGQPNWWPTAAIDVDGVLVDASGLYLEAWRAAGITVDGREPRKADIQTYDFRAIPGISDPQRAHELAMTVYSRPDLYDGYAPMAGALEALEELRLQARVIAVSCPTVGHADSKLRFLQALGFELRDIFLAPDKLSIKWDVLLDDAPHYLARARQARRKVVCFTQPWNQALTDLDSIRVHTWPEALAALEAELAPNALLEADRLINGDRQQDYGHPSVDFGRTAHMATGLLSDKLQAGVELDVHDVWQFMCLVKLSRLRSTPGHRDSIVDLAGYAGCGEKCLE